MIQRIVEEKCCGEYLLCHAALCALFSLVAVQPASAAGEPLTVCAQRFPDREIERLKCYDQLVSPGPEGAEPDQAPLPLPASEGGGDIERSYFTRAWNLDNLSNLDPSKLGDSSRTGSTICC